MERVSPALCTCGSCTNILFEAPRQRVWRGKEMQNSNHSPDTSFPLTFRLNCFATVDPPAGLAVTGDERSTNPQRTLRIHELRRPDVITEGIDECCKRSGDMTDLRYG